LSQLSEEYELCLDNITTTAKLLTVKKEALPDLRARFREQTLRYEEAAKAREQKQKADDLKKELAWSHVAAKEEEMTKKIEEAAKLGRRLPKIKENIEEAQVGVSWSVGYECHLMHLFLQLGGLRCGKRSN
jgi:structural maintenance of chromosomes protein 6